jgi:uncharacterized OB-fold protein
MIIPFKEGVMHLASSATNAQNHLIGSKCQHCGAVAFPKRAVCHKCLSEDVVEIPLSKRGKLASFTVAWAAPEGIKPPLTLGYIDLPEGVRLLSMVTGNEPSQDAMELEQDMDLVFEEIRTDTDGNHIVAFKFKPVSKGGES